MVMENQKGIEKAKMLVARHHALELKYKKCFSDENAEKIRTFVADYLSEKILKAFEELIEENEQTAREDGKVKKIYSLTVYADIIEFEKGYVFQNKEGNGYFYDKDGISFEDFAENLMNIIFEEAEKVGLYASDDFMKEDEKNGYKSQKINFFIDADFAKSL